jgi:pimeloyl-ACP methyl ester carboxylesterase
VPAVRFFDDPGMDFATRCVLSGVHDGLAEVGEVLATVHQITDGDPDSWFDTWIGLGRRLRAVGDAAAAAGHRVSAHGAYLRAANYLFAGNYWAPQTRDPSRAAGVWEEHRRAWEATVDHWPSPVTRIELPWGPGYRFAPRAGPVRATVVIVNGIDTPMSDTTMTGLCAGLERGYEVVCFDGPGQGWAWIANGNFLTPDWGNVLGAVLDQVGDNPVCLMGINHGGLFAARAAAAHPDRVDALVFDPAVLRITADDVAGLPDLHRPWRPRHDWGPYALSDDEIAAIRCPTFVAVAEQAESFAGHGEALAARLTGPVHVERFTAAEGAGLDCEIGAAQVRNQRVYDWLDDQLP